MKPTLPNTRRNTWQPILDGSLAERSRTTVQEIVAALPAPSSMEISSATLAGGTAGLAVLCAYLSRAGYDESENATEFLERAMQAVSAEPMGTSLYAGFVGVAWVMTHLQEQLYDAAEQDPCEAIDEALLTYLKRSPWCADYDLIGGLVGLGVYLLDRLPRPSAVECLELVIDRLDETAERQPHGITWLTPPELLPEHERAECPAGCYDLGLAHGVPGVIAFLGAACAAGVARDKARPLLDGAVAWLLTQKLPGGADAIFSYWIAPGLVSKPSRLAWCYGDLGVAAALLCAARCVGEQAWEREALRIARSAARREPEGAGVKDAGLCHGAAGLGHIFNRLFQATGETVFKQAARYWFEQTLEMRRHGQGIAGFSAYLGDGDGTPRWDDDPGILTGAPGIALALLAAVTDIEPAWDRMLLVSNSTFNERLRGSDMIKVISCGTGVPPVDRVPAFIDCIAARGRYFPETSLLRLNSTATRKENSDGY